MDTANGNFHLASGDTDAIDKGTPLGFTVDIDNVARSGTWDLGADEYVAAGGAFPSAITNALIRGGGRKK